MSTIIAHPAQEAHPDRDAAARKRAARLAMATADQLQAALAYLSMIDPEAFEIAFTAVAPVHNPIQLCHVCIGFRTSERRLGDALPPANELHGCRRDAARRV